MQPAIVLASTHATVKHNSLNGHLLVVLQPVGVDDRADGPPLIAVDPMGSRKGDRVVMTSDGRHAREVCNSDQTPCRWIVLGVIDS
ncbi:MAG: EutN/CcmL family microcompartment protein [Planctomycetota bacterium]